VSVSCTTPSRTQKSAAEKSNIEISKCEARQLSWGFLLRESLRPVPDREVDFIRQLGIGGPIPSSANVSGRTQPYSQGGRNFATDALDGSHPTASR
jgi:hypothetical protein